MRGDCVSDLDRREAQQQTLKEQALAALPSTETESRSEPALRLDAGKIRYDLIPGDSLHELAKIFTAGAAKYADRNWEKGMSWSRCFGPLMRHAWKWWRGEEYDDGPGGTGCHHMAIVAWNAMVLCSYAMRKVGVDDRVILTNSPAITRSIIIAERAA